MPPEIPTELRHVAALNTARVTAAATGDGQAKGPRTISAQLAAYGATVTPMSAWSSPVRLAAGAFTAPADPNAVKLLRDHDRTQVIGAMTAYDENDTGPAGTFRLARTSAADEAFVLAEDGILDSVSVGYRVLDASFVVEDGEDVLEVTAAELFEVSLVGHPADAAARISSVTATRKEHAVPTPPVETEFTTAQMDAVLAHVQQHMAPATVAPIAAPVTAEPRIIDAHGNPVALVHARMDPRIPAVLGRDGKRYTAGDFFSSYATAVNEGDWTRHNEIKAALADELTSDVPGLLPQQIVGELLGRAADRRRVWDSLTPRDMPMIGAKFSRPRITQHVKVDKQATQKTNPASQKYTVTLDEVSKDTYAGALDVSQQALDWTSPSLLNELVIDFTRLYVQRTNKAAADALIAAQTAGAKKVTWDGTAATFNKALADAALLVTQGVPAEQDAIPNTIWLAVDQWALIAGLTDTTGRPLVPQVGPMNAWGTIDLADPNSGIQGGSSFRWVVDKTLPAGTFIMGDRTYTESYENGRRFLQAIRPDVLGLDIAYMGYAATYFPYNATLVAIGPAAGGGS